MFKSIFHKLMKAILVPLLENQIFVVLIQYFIFVISFLDEDFHELCQKKECLLNVFDHEIFLMFYNLAVISFLIIEICLG